MLRRGFLISMGAGASCARRSGEAKVRLGIAAQQSVSQIPVYLGERLNLYGQNGLKVELSEFAGASKGMEALLGGSLDVLSGYYTQALQVRAQGRPVSVFLGYFDSLLVALAVAPQAAVRIRSIEELKGAKVGVTTLGSATHQFLDAMLRAHHLPPDAVTPVAIGTAARAAAAMERGVVDAGVITDFTIRYLERRFGAVALLADTRTRDGVQQAHGVRSFPGSALMAPAVWLQENAALARKLSLSVSQAAAWMKQHSAEEIAAAMPASHYGEDKEAYLSAIRYAIPMLSEPGAIDAATHNAAARFLGDPSMATAFTAEFLPR